MTKELAIKIISGEVLGTTEQTHEAIKMAIKALLSAQPEIIRCRDCEYYNGNYHYCVNDIFVETDGYCHYGKRKEDETD